MYFPIKPLKFHKRLVVVAPKWYGHVKERYPNRKVECSFYCPDDDMYYMTAMGHFRRVDMLDGSIWEGNGYTGFMFKIRS